jgi:hypothetical protein
MLPIVSGTKIQQNATGRGNRMSSRFIMVRDAPDPAIVLVAGREISSAPSGWSPPAPAQTLLRYAHHKSPARPYFHGGAIATRVPVQLLFWGDFWTAGDGTLQEQEIREGVIELLAGPYCSALDQYGIAPPVFGGSRIVTRPVPPTDDPVRGSVVGPMVEALIDAGIFPDPDDPGGRNAYMVMLPPGVRTVDEGDGAHADFDTFDGPFDMELIWIAWCHHDPDSAEMLGVFSHELIELVTDPDPGGGWFDDTLEHREGELSDLCEVDPLWQTAFVGNVKVAAYWSMRDQACVIPTHPLSVRIDGMIVVNRRVPNGSGSQEHPFGESPGLCALLPRCCFSGPYEWTRTRVHETASLHATPSGYHAASFAWTIDRRPVSGSGTVEVAVGVTRDTPTGPAFAEETVTLAFVESGDELTVTNAACDGSFEVTVTVVTDETRATNATGGRRSASVVLPFHGLDFEWDSQFAEDQQACAQATESLWVREHLELALRIRGIDTGPLHADDIAVLSRLGAIVSEDQHRAARVALRYVQLLQESHPAEAAHLRHSLLAGIGILSTPSG